jgi:hypothetical protein
MDVGALIALCIVGLLGLYFLGACILAPLLSRKPKEGDEKDVKESSVRFVNVTAFFGSQCDHGMRPVYSIRTTSSQVP